MSYQALYRKWRPLIFDDVIGQEHITTTLKNEILNNRVAHAYLFTGTRGTGKTSTAKILSRAINCKDTNNGNPCNKCEICEGIFNETIMDIIEIDAASNTGVDNIRSIIEQVQYTPTVAKYKVYIIDEVHMLSSGAFNALLKTLEEPPKHVVFILATTEVHKIPATILSRCQRFDFKTISVSDIKNRIKLILDSENINATDDAIGYVAHLGNGSMRDALSILDQCLAFKNNDISYEDVVNICGGLDDEVLYKIADFISDGNTKSAITQFYELIKSGKNTDNFCTMLLDIFSQIMLSNISFEVAQYSFSEKRNKLIFDISKKFSHEKIIYCINILNELLNNLKFTKNSKVLITTAIIRMCEPCLYDDNSALLVRIKELEEKINQIAENGVMSTLKPQINKKENLEDNSDELADCDDELVNNDFNIKKDLIENNDYTEYDDENKDVDNMIKVQYDDQTDNEKDEDNNINKDNNKNCKTVKVSAQKDENIKKIVSGWGNVIKKSIETNQLVVNFAISDTLAEYESGFLVIKVKDEDKKSRVVSARERIAEFLADNFNVSVDIKVQVYFKEQKILKSMAALDKLDVLSKKFPQNFNTEI